MTNVQAEARDGVHVIRIDDGKVNALSPAVVQRRARRARRGDRRRPCRAAVRAPGFLSAGFDLKVMRGDPDERAQLVAEGRRLLLRLFAHERPVVVACTGNAIAAGAGLLMAADWRVGARGEFKLGFNEVAIGHVLYRSHRGARPLPHDARRARGRGPRRPLRSGAGGGRRAARPPGGAGGGGGGRLRLRPHGWLRSPPRPTGRSSGTHADRPRRPSTASSPRSDHMTAVLEGVRILEVAEHTFVPAASALLADWGAEIIKIEHVERGDAMRGLASTGVGSRARRRPRPARALEPWEEEPGPRPHLARGPRHPLPARRHRRRVPHQQVARGA